jgi:tetratricopeptide (TPR) repeat protein
MSRPDRQSLLHTFAIIAAGLFAAVLLSGYVQRQKPLLEPGYEDSDLLLQGSRLKGFVLGAEGLVADWYWMQSLQYIGRKMIAHKAEDLNLDDLRSLNPRLLFPMLNAATDLDPNFIAAYAYGAVVLPAINPDDAIAIAQKGIRNNPEQWRLYQHLGYIYWKLGRYEEAATAYEEGSRIAGAAPFMKLMAAALRSEGGSRSVARLMFRQMLETSSDDAVRLTAQRRLDELQALDELDAINEKLATLRTRRGECVTSLEEIASLLKDVRLPEGEFRLDSRNRLADPTGTPYRLDRENCRAEIDYAASGLPKMQ